jgi:glyceraldehyde 3-phosphate dehydrogenase
MPAGPRSGAVGTFPRSEARHAREWAGINDVMDIEMLAQLLRHDSVYGPFPGAVEVLDGALRVDGRRI